MKTFMIILLVAAAGAGLWALAVKPNIAYRKWDHAR